MGRWRKEVGGSGLLLPRAIRRSLLRRALKPKGLRPTGAHARILREYGALLRANERLRRCLARARGAKKPLVETSHLALRWILERAVLPLWLGTRWDFYGTAIRPHRGSIACGYFLVHGLLSVGFRFPETFWYPSKRRGRMKIYEFAKQSAFAMARKLSSPGWKIVQSGRSPRALAPFLRSRGAGIYVLGLDNHVGLVLYDGRTPYFWHSAFEEPSTWVKRELLYASGVVRASRLKMLAKIAPARIQGWLLGRPLRVKPLSR